MKTLLSAMVLMALVVAQMGCSEDTGEVTTESEVVEATTTEAPTTTTKKATTTSTVAIEEIPEATRQTERAFLRDFTTEVLLFGLTVSSGEFDDSFEVARAVSALEGIQDRVKAMDAPTVRTGKIRTELLGTVRVFLEGWTAVLNGNEAEARRIFQIDRLEVEEAGERIGSMLGELIRDTGYELTSEQQALLDSTR